MILSLKSKITFQQVVSSLMIIALIAILYLMIVHNPIGNLNLMITMNALIFVFIACLMYNLIEIYFSFFKKTIMSEKETLRGVELSVLSSLNLTVLFVLSQINTLNILTFIVWLLTSIFITYAKTND
ncbi:MAG: hypothetical protein ACRCXZ_05870 [Patescibacteria group bacterium]